MREPFYPGVAEPERTHAITSFGVRLQVLEWGDPQRQPIVLCHGMWDHARSFARLAPLLAERFRVFALDARGHGDSAWADGYTWVMWVTDIVTVLRWIGRPAHLIGHSMGGGQATDAARSVPALVRQLVNIDGFGPPLTGPDIPPLPVRFTQFLDARRRLTARPGWRAYGDLDELVERRRAQNPRLSRQWLRFFVYHAARRREDGWHWKADPQMAIGIGPWLPEWIGPSYGTLRVPMLAVVGSEPDTWGPLPEPILAERLSRVPQLERRTVTGAGHFVHIEQPEETARLILDFLEQ